MNPHDPKGAAGAAKKQLHLVPVVALEETAAALTLGVRKYGPWNWRHNQVCVSTYMGAALRHGFAYFHGEDQDPESKASHLGHAMACICIVLDADRHGTLVDDRPTHKDSLQVAPAVKQALTTAPEPSQAAEEWRELGPDEVIQEGDEVKGIGFGVWIPADMTIGYTVENSDMLARRRITPLTLEVGKWYENRRGEKVGPMKTWHNEFWPFSCEGLIFSPLGKYGCNTDDPELTDAHVGDSPLDLIREVPAPSEFPEVEKDLPIHAYAKSLPEIPVPDYVHIEFTNGRPTRIAFQDPDGKDGPEIFPGMILFHNSGQVAAGTAPAEMVTEPPIPEGFPPVPETPGFRKVNRGLAWKSDGPVNYLYACHSWRLWNQKCAYASARPDAFYIELIPEEPTGEDSAKSDIVNPISEPTYAPGLAESLGLPPDSFAKSIERQKQEDLEEQREYRKGICNKITLEQAEEEKAKAALEPGWLWFGDGPVSGVDGERSKDIALWSIDKGWLIGAEGLCYDIIYAIRAGTELARLNRLEPVKKSEESMHEAGDVYRIQRYNVGLKQAGTMQTVPDGGWVRYSDHLAAISALRGKGGEKV